jgi:uncharacterized protein (DUF885 family)
MRVLLLSLLATIAACRATTTDHAPSAAGDDASSWPDAAGNTQDARLAQLCRDGWEFALRCDPVEATYLGDARMHGKLFVPSPENESLQRRELAELLRRLDAIDRWSLAGEDQTTYGFLRELWQTRFETLQLAVDEASWNLDPRSGPQVDFPTLATMQPIKTEREREQLLQRWRLMPGYVDQCRVNIERGIAHGRVASYSSVSRVLAQVDELVKTPLAHSPLTEPGRRDLGQARDLAAWRDQLDEVTAKGIYPAFERYRDTLRNRLLPLARPDDKPGILFVDGGIEAYRVAIHRHTSLDLSASEIHGIGLAEVARIRGEIAALGKKVFGTEDLAQIQLKLRTNPALHFRTREEVEAKAASALAKANAIVAANFGLQPKVACEVVRVPEHEERDTTIGYYREAAADGSRLGRYYINTFDPQTRTRYDAEALAFHESVPGHHLQGTIAQELTGMPLLRRFFGSNAYVEGWALYCERLADELGLYSSDTDRLGMLSFDAWRAARLVVDTGIHSMGWTRDTAIAYLKDNTLLAENNVVNEVDRYIAWPGQALGYKLGSREIFALRDEARQKLGARFKLADFHDHVLAAGPLPLPLLRERIEAWLKPPPAAKG